MPLWSGHDCAIIEGFGEKICNMIEEKWQKYLQNCPDVDAALCFKDKISTLQNKHIEEVNEIIINIEAAKLVDDSALSETEIKNQTEHNEDLSMIIEENCDDSDIEMLDIPSEEPAVLNRENIEPVDEIPNELEDSFDRLIKKYQPKQIEVQTKVTATVKQSPTSLSALPNRQLKKFKSFNTNVAGPSYASSPIASRVQNLPVSRSPKRAMKEKLDGLSPIIPEKRRKISEKKDDNVVLSPPKFSHPSPEEKEDDGRKYISVDEINPQDYEVILIIDIGEAKSKEKCEIQTKISRQDVKSEVRKLHVGDFAWIAKHKTKKNLPELILPYIIERKRLDDLASSIKDKRFHEQKFRLKQCGIENIIYLIENLNASSYGLPFETLTQAVSNTLIQNRFQVKVTDNSDHTVMYLAVMTSFIFGIFMNKQPIKFKMLEFEAFNQGSVKQKKLTVRETFIKQLLSLKGLSVDMALEITKYYPTPSHLYEKYLTLNQSDGENLLTKITIGELKRKIPSPVSKVIYHFYMRK